MENRAEISRIIVKLDDAIRDVLKDFNIKVAIGKEFGILGEESNDLIIYAKIRIKSE